MPMKGLQAASIPLLHLKATANIFRITLLTDMALPTLMTKPRLQAACKRGFHIMQSEAYLSSFLLLNCGKAEPWPKDNKPASA